VSMPTSGIVWSLEDCMKEDRMKEVSPVQTSPRFNKLIQAQQSEVANSDVPNNGVNFRGLPQSLNGSTGSQIDWTRGTQGTRE
jgi:hypothetical protein